MSARFLGVQLRAVGLACLGWLVLSSSATAADIARASLGVFTSQTDVGAPALRGSGAYDPETETYTLAGAGKNMWFDEDEFHFVWKQMKDDFILRYSLRVLQAQRSRG